MKNRMNVPKEYEPVLPGIVKEYLEKKRKAQPQFTIDLETADTEAMDILYAILDTGKFDVGFKLTHKETRYTLIGTDAPIVELIAQGLKLPLME